MKIFTIVLRVILGLLLFSPILGALGLFPPPTPELYNTTEAFAFIDILMNTGYLTQLIAIVFAIAIFLVITNRTALAALLILPITINIICFHAFLDGGLFTKGAIMANVLVLLNAYFLWHNRAQYRHLWNKSVSHS
ncbi:MAG: hypothetical protein AB197_00235 [Parcubacteria bacterium C7867-002]|nr:MAG: hypothetical protein AB197_00235 [Parcubacteria bacterium C7867-002]